MLDRRLMLAGTLAAVALPAAASAAQADSSALTVSQSGSNATVTWTAPYNPGGGFSIGRDGYNIDGYGPWRSWVPGSSRQWTFKKLVTGRTYTFTISSSLGTWSTSVTMGAVTEVAAAAPAAAAPAAAPAAATASGRSPLGPSRSGLPWHSGAFFGSPYSTATANQFGDWRGRALDAVVSYANYDSLSAFVGSEYTISVYSGFAGRLAYSVPLGFKNRAASLASIGWGEIDYAYRDLAGLLVKHGHGDAIIRLGWEFQLSEWPWYTTASTAGDFRNAYRRVVSVMRGVAPNLKFDFCLNVCSGLNGSGDRLAPLNLAYPGDDVVDLVGADIYDWWETTPAQWNNALRGARGPGLADIADFARAHGKGVSIGEWGLAQSTSSNNYTGRGDDPTFIDRMWEFMQNNSDVLALECYFNEPNSYLRSSLTDGSNWNAGARYRSLW